MARIVSFVPTNRGGKSAYCDGFKFRHQKTATDKAGMTTVRYKCHHESCPAKLVLVDEVLSEEKSNRHCLQMNERSDRMSIKN